MSNQASWISSGAVLGTPPATVEVPTFRTPLKPDWLNPLTPVSRNPWPQQTCYNPWNPAVGSDQFVGRSIELKRLEVALYHPHSVNLVGDPWIGKTSLLTAWVAHVKALARIFGREVRFLNGEGSEGKNLASFVQAMTGQIAPEQPDLAANELSKWAKSVGRPDLRPLIIVDDADGLLQRVDPRFWERLRAMLLDDLLVILGTKAPIGLLGDRPDLTSPLANLLETIWVGLLSPTAGDQLVNRGSPYWHKGDLELLRHWCGNHPFFLQLFGSHLAQVRLEGRSDQVALDIFLVDAKSCLDQLKKTWSPRKQAELQSLAQGRDINFRPLRDCGLLTSKNRAFGEILIAFLRNEI